jgi:hypothetical protein
VLSNKLMYFTLILYIDFCTSSLILLTISTEVSNSTSYKHVCKKWLKNEWKLFLCSQNKYQTFGDSSVKWVKEICSYCLLF